MLRRHTYDDELEIMKKEVEMAAGGLSDASAHARGGMGLQHDQLGRAHSSAEVALRQGMEGGGGGRFQGGGRDDSSEILKDHLFEKAVTPSDVGKLNRLVIPKQHAERCFPLDLSLATPAQTLSFEDEGGKHWRFRWVV